MLPKSEILCFKEVVDLKDKQYLHPFRNNQQLQEE